MAKLLRLSILFLLLAWPAAAQDRKQVDLALAMAIDISGSIDPDEAHLQREGYVQAFRDPVIVKGTERQLDWGDGWTDWNVTWEQFLKGSALPHNPVSAGPSPSVAPS